MSKNLSNSSFPSINKLLSSMEKEILQSDPSPESFTTFNPLLWLSSADRTYVTDAGGICLQDSSEVFRIFAHELCLKLQAFSSLSGSFENPAKYILVLCEILRLLPLNYIANTCSIQIFHIIQVRFNALPEVYSSLFIPAVKRFIANAIPFGANPLKLLFHQVHGDFTPCEFIDQMSYAMFSEAAFRTAIKGFDNFLGDVTAENRVQFLQCFYKLIYSFYLECPKDHESLIKTGFPEAEALIDKLYKPKSKPEPELIAIICALMPMCHNKLKEATNSKKSHLFVTVAHKVKNAKAKNANKKYYITCGTIELLDAKIISSKIEGSPFNDFYEKHCPKIKQPQITHKLLESFTPEQRLHIYPRSMAIMITNNSDSNSQVSSLLELVKDENGWPYLTQLLQWLMKGYPVENVLNEFPPNIYEKMMFSLNEFMETLKNRNTDSITRTQALENASMIIDLLTNVSPKYTLYSILSAQDVQTYSVDVPMFFNPQSFMKFDIRASDLIQVFHRQVELVKNIIRLLAQTGSTKTNSFTTFLQTFFTFNKLMIEGVKNNIILEEIIEIARTFQEELKVGIRLNSPNLVHFPIIYGMFLHWAYLVLSVTINDNKGKISTEDSRLFLLNNFLLRSLCNDKILDYCEKILGWMYQIYGINEKNAYIRNYIPTENSDIINITQYIFETYIGFVTKLLETKKIQVANIGQPTIYYHVTRAKINSMTPFMLSTINLLSKRNIPSNQSISFEEFFFSTIYSYISVTEVNDNRFAESFEFLNPISTEKFLKIMSQHINQATNEFKYDNPRFWLTIINVMASISSKQKLSKESVGLSVNIISKLFNILQYGSFGDRKTEFAKSLGRYVSLFYTTQDTEIYQNQRLSIIMILFENGLYYGDKSNDKFNEEMLTSVCEPLPQLFDNFNMNETIVNQHIADYSSELKLMKTIIFFLTSLQKFVENLQTIRFINIVQLTLNSILRNNSATAWKVYVYIAKDASTLFQCLLIESLTLLCGMSFSLTSDSYKSLTSTALKTNNSGEQQRKRASTASENDTSLYLNTLLTSARSVRNEQHPFEIEEKEQIYQVLTRNNFELFKKPPSLNHIFIEASILYLFAYNKNLELFKTMAKECNENNLQNDNSISVFFTAWFKLMASKDQTNQIIKLIQTEENIIDFIENFNPTSQFAYYLALFSKLTSTKLATTLFIERYLKKLLQNPVQFDASIKINNKLNIMNYINKLKSSPQFEKLMNTIFNIEEIYINKDSFDTISNDMNIITAFVGLHKTPFDRSEFVFQHPDLSPEDESKLYYSNCIQEIGLIENSRGYFIDLVKIPILKPGIITSYFYKFFEKVDQFQLFINLTLIPKHIVEEFPLIIKNAPTGFISKIRKIVLLNPSILVQNLLMKDILPAELPKSMKDIVVVLNDLSSILTPKDLIYFPEAAFGNISEYRCQVPVKYNGKEAYLVFAESSIAVSLTKSFLGTNVLHTLYIGIDTIRSIVETDNGVEIFFDVHKLDGSVLQNHHLKLPTQYKKYIIQAYELMKCKVGKYIQSSEIVITISSSFRVQMISFSLLLIAQNQATLMNQAIQLFEAAIHSGKPVVNCSVYVADDCTVNMTNLFKEVVEKNLVSDVVENLSLLLKINQSEAALKNLLPLFIEFMNSSDNVPLMYTVLSNLFEISYTNTAYASILTSYFLNDLTSELAIEVAFYLIAQINTIDESQNTITQKFSIARRAAQAFMRKHGSLVGKIVIDTFFDGTICQKCYGDAVNPTKIFSIISKLSFNCPEYVLTNLPLFFFSTIMSGVYTTLELISLVKSCYEAMFCSLLSIFPNSERIINKSRDKILQLLEHPKVLPAIKLIDLVDKLMESFGKDYQKDFRELFNKTLPNDNPSIFYLKTTANIYFTGGTKEIVIDLIKNLPKLFKSIDFSYQKLAICLESIASAIKIISNDMKTIKYLVWVSLFAANHSNTMLRIAANKLLHMCLQCMFEPKQSIESIRNQVSDNNKIKNDIKNLESSLNINFERDFYQAFVMSLMRSIEEIDTRQTTISIFNLCVDNLLDSSEKLIYFVVPLITFGNEDTVKALTQKITNGKPLEEFIFNVISKFGLQESAWLVKVITNFFGQRTCLQSVDCLARVLIYASKKHQIFFVPIVNDLVNRCWKMIETESSLQRIDSISALAAALLGINSTDNKYAVQYDKINFTKMEDAKVNDLISEALELLAKNE